MQPITLVRSSSVESLLIRAGHGVKVYGSSGLSSSFTAGLRPQLHLEHSLVLSAESFLLQSSLSLLCGRHRLLPTPSPSPTFFLQHMAPDRPVHTVFLILALRSPGVRVAVLA